MPQLGMYTYRSRGSEIMLTVFVLRLIDTMIMVSVWKLGSLGTSAPSWPSSRMFSSS